MPNIRIKDIPTTASATVNGDFFAVDSNASTRKLNAFSPAFGGQILAADGTAAAPSLSFSNDTNTGFYKVGAATDVLYFGANGAASLRYTTNGSIYGGTNNSYLQINPTSDIYASVDSSSNGSIILEPKGTGNVVIRNLNGIGTRTRLEIAQTGLRVYHMEVTATGADFAFGDGGGEYFRLSASTYQTLFGTNVNSNNGRIQLATHTTISGGIGFGTDTSIWRNFANQLTTSAGTLIGNGGGIGYFSITTTGSAPLVLGANGVESFRIDGSTQNAVFAKDILLGTSGPSVPSTLSGRAPRQGLVFNGSAGSTVSSLPVIGSGNFTVVAWVTPASLTGTQCIVGGPNNSFVLRMDSGVLGIGKQSIDGPIAISSTLTANKGVLVVYTRSGTTGTGYVDGIAGTPIVDSRDYSIANSLVGCSVDTATAVWNGSISGPIIYNRALSAAEVKALYETGVPAAADINSASNTSLLTGANSDFSSVGNWSPNPPANISGGKLNLLATHATNTGVTLIAGKRYRLVCTIDSITAGFFAVFNGVSYLSVATAAGAVSYEFNVAATTLLFVRCTGGDAVVDNMFIYPVGAVLAPDASQRGSYLTWYDTSGNNSHITLPSSGVTWNVPASPILNLVGTPTTLSSFVNMYTTSLTGGDATGGRMTWYSSGTGNVETGFLQVTQPDGFGGTFSIGLNTTNSGTASTVFQIKKNGNTLLGTTTDNTIGKLQVEGAITSTTSTNSGVLQLNLINNSTGNSASSLMRFNAGTRTASLQAYNDTHATLAGQLRIATSNGDISIIPSGVTAITFGASLITASVGVKYANSSVVNGTTVTPFQADIGADATLGALQVLVGGSPSATGANRFGFIAAGDVGAWRRVIVGSNVTSGGGQVLIPATDVSNSTSSGALVVSGGVGVGGAIFAGGNIQCNAVYASNNTTLYLRPQGATISSGEAQLATTGNLTLTGSVRTSAPSGGTAANWKLGSVATVSPTSPNRTIEVDIGGTIYYIHAKTTNN